MCLVPRHATTGQRRRYKPAPGGGNHVGVGETTDQLRTTTAEFSALERSTMDTSDKWFTLDHRGGPIWGSRGREFNSRQPDNRIQHHRTLSIDTSSSHRRHR